MVTAIQYHSQPATSQDKWLIEKSGALVTRPGYFVEIGAHNGLHHSNTLTLEECFGWRGALVEANPSLYLNLVANRSQNQCYKCAVGSDDLPSQPFVLGDSFSGLVEHMHPKWLREHSLRQNPIINVETCTLWTLFQRLLAPATIDYLSLDVEGAEYAILDAFFNKPYHFSQPNYVINYMTVEFLFDSSRLRDLKRLLQPNYILHEVRAFDACFIRRELYRERY